MRGGERQHEGWGRGGRLMSRPVVDGSACTGIAMLSGACVRLVISGRVCPVAFICNCGSDQITPT